MVMELLPSIIHDGWILFRVKKDSPHELVGANWHQKNLKGAFAFNDHKNDSLPEEGGFSCLFGKFELKHLICREASLSF